MAFSECEQQDDESKKWRGGGLVRNLGLTTNHDKAHSVHHVSAVLLLVVLYSESSLPSLFTARKYVVVSEILAIVSGSRKRSIFATPSSLYTAKNVS